jgi:hypothetical protein
MKAEHKFEPSEDEEDEEESKDSASEDTTKKKIRRKMGGRKVIQSYQEWMEMRLREIHELHKPMDYEALNKHSKDTDVNIKERKIKV